ncbi:ABC transporter permease [Allosediminivita pacifica]|uniref:Peptide/nickel transport system permease protein n=1 Tax=Allosediminivita pacifica TaxID=1267769 RepID=A0A2T6ATT3_9RHOB|nr:ABC transporter permease [Allosediminivita pacifica]PTX47230.1 peptide/nickel transport system permease protein [Allosediminivita pacifica]GGB09250.1 ABC transporter permease [Allosediminivita pacifica]
MQILRYILKRLLFVIPQMLGILFISFFLIKLIPGDPAVLMLGPNATADAVAKLRAEMGLDLPVFQQFMIYLGNVLQGDLGMSWQSARPVLSDLMTRFPATLELVTLSLLLAVVIGLGLGIASAMRPRGAVRKAANYYGLLSGAIPDFWLALVFIFVFYTLLGWAPAPLGRYSIMLIPPQTITGSVLVDSLITGRFDVFMSALSHLALPVLTLGLVNAGPILKATQSSMDRALGSDFIAYARMNGLPRRMIRRQALRAALPNIITIISVLYSFTIGAAVLVEIVFGWGGAGQYAVAGVLNSDLNPVLGFVIFSAVLSLIVYLIVDLLYFALDPRTRG